MIRKLKGLGIALIAVFAIGASGAGASQYTSTDGNYPVTVTGTQPVGSPHELTIGPRTITCPEAHFEGSLVASSSTLTITPEYSGICSASGLPATYTLGTTGHNCDLLFHAESTEDSNMDIVCGAGESMTLDIWGSKAAHEAKSAPVCEITIKPQTGLKTVGLKNTGSGTAQELDVTFSLSLTASVKGNVLVCGTNGERPATYKGTVTLRSEFNRPSEYTSTDGDYPVTATGTQPEGSRHEFRVGPNTIVCPSAHFVGTLSAPSSTLTITPSYSGICSSSGLGGPATVTLGTTGHKCDFLFHAESTEDSNVDIVCETGNDITVDVWGNKSAHETGGAPVCEITIKPQTGLKTVGTRNTGSGTTQDVDVTANVSLTANVKGNALVCGTNGERAATYSGTVTLQGTFDGLLEGIMIGDPVANEGIMVGD